MACDTQKLCCEAAQATTESSCGCCKPILCHEQYRQSYRTCCDENGCCCKYPCSCRDPFWPEFAHPRGLCCADLYSGKDSRCMTVEDSETECDCK